MPFRIDERPFNHSKRDYLVFTRRHNGSIVGPGTVRHPIGTDEVEIEDYGNNFTNYDSGKRRAGMVTIGGRKSLAHLRDALVRICQERGIP